VSHCSRVVATIVALVACTTVEAQPAPRPGETVGTLDFFGLRRLSELDVRAALKIEEGDPFERDAMGSLVAKLEKIPGVRKATVTPVTVDGTGKLSVFIGVQETGAAGFTLREPPEGTQRLPDALAQTYRDFMAALGPSVQKGGDREDHSQGHALNSSPQLRKPQDLAIVQLEANTAAVRDVLRSSRFEQDRAAAAWLLGYAPDKKAIVPDLVEAARDADATVRNNATRALGVIAELAAAQPRLGISIPPDLFVDMLHSVTWTDRNKVSFLLMSMTNSGEPELLRMLRARALPELVEIARWKSKGHALPAALILGRIAGWKDEHTAEVWNEGGAEKIIAAAMTTTK
jgi:uncharacterized membrane protein